MELEEKEVYIKQIGDFLDEVEHYHKKSGNETALSVYVGDCITTTCLPGEIYINTNDVYFPAFSFVQSGGAEHGTGLWNDGAYL